jgi:hypothetical protein
MILTVKFKHLKVQPTFQYSQKFHDTGLEKSVTNAVKSCEPIAKANSN